MRYSKRICETCGKQFVPVTAGNITCSENCRKKRKRDLQHERKNLILEFIADIEWLDCRHEEMQALLNAKIKACDAFVNELKQAKREISALEIKLEDANCKLLQLSLTKIQNEKILADLEDAKAQIRELEKQARQDFSCQQGKDAPPVQSGKNGGINPKKVKQPASAQRDKKAVKCFCEHCGKPFTSLQGEESYCSPQCRDEHMMGRLN